MECQALYLTWDPSAQGITQRSLRNLRTALVDSFRRPTAIIRVPTSSICFGYLLIVQRPHHAGHFEAIWTGDGFRSDEIGEGGRGAAAAYRLLDLFGPRWIHSSEPLRQIDYTNLIEIHDDPVYREIKEMAERQVCLLDASDFQIAADGYPEY